MDEQTEGSKWLFSDSQMVSGLSHGVMRAKLQTDPLSTTSSEQSIQCGHSSFYLANLLSLLNHV